MNYSATKKMTDTNNNMNESKKKIMLKDMSQTHLSESIYIKSKNRQNESTVIKSEGKSGGINTGHLHGDENFLYFVIDGDEMGVYNFSTHKLNS